MNRRDFLKLSGQASVLAAVPVKVLSYEYEPEQVDVIADSSGVNFGWDYNINLGRTYYVGENATGDGSGSDELNCMTLAEACEDCDSGDTIKLKSGTYNSPISIINKNNISIIGESHPAFNYA